MKQLWGDHAPTRRALPPPRRRRGAGAAHVCAFCLREAGSAVAKLMTGLALLALVLLAMMEDGELRVPRLSGDLGQVLAGAPRAEAPEVSVGGIGLSLDPARLAAGVTFDDIRVSRGGMEVHLPRVVTGLDMRDALAGELRPRRVRVEGAALRIARDLSGHFSVGAAADAPMAPVFAAGGAPPPDLGALVARIAGLGTTGALGALDAADLADVAIRYEDARDGRVWTADAAAARLRRRSGRIHADIDARVTGGAGPMDVTASLDVDLDGGTTRMRLGLDDARPEDLASQFRALDWLALVDAPVDAHIAAEVSGTGALRAMDAVLELGAGTIRAGDGATLPFESAKAYLAYDPEADRLRVDAVEVASPLGTLRAEGQVLLTRGAAGRVATLVAQMTVHGLTADARPHIERPLAFEGGEAAVRVTVDPFRVEIGEARLSGAEGAVRVSGRLWPEGGRWGLALDVATPRLPYRAALDLWPPGLRGGVRTWLAERLSAGDLENFVFHLRSTGEKPRIAMDFDFANAEMEILRTLPAIEGAAGHGTIMGDRLDLVLDRGTAEVREGRRIDLAGSRFEIADMRARPATGRAVLTGEGGIGDLLALIDRPPFRLTSRIGLEAGVASGRAEVAAELALPLRDGLTPADVDVRVAATLSDVESAALVPGRRVRAETLELAASREAVTLTGAAALDGVPLRFDYRRPLGPGTEGRSRVTGSLALTPAALDGLGIPLPAGMVEGEGRARFALDLAPGAPPAYDVTADLTGNRLAMPALGWAKGPGRGAELSVRGVLGSPPRIDRLSFSGPGLDAEGRLALAAGGLREARLDRLRVGGWLDAPVVFRPRPGGASVEIRGGTVDLRDLPPRRGGGGVDLAIADARVRVTDRIALTAVTGDLGAGPRGRFRGRINGGTPVNGVLRAGPTVYLEARDGGAALRDAGLYGNVRGGVLRVSLADLGGGVFDGRFSLQDARVVNAPVLAEVIAGADPIGLIDRLGGAGIGFDDAQGWFTLAPDRLTLARARATGPSLGVTLSGVYLPGADRLDMEGVVSPFYTLNGLPARIPVLGRVLGGRAGEGLLGITFRVGGRASAPAVSVNPLSLLTPGAARDIFLTRDD